MQIDLRKLPDKLFGLRLMQIGAQEFAWVAGAAALVVWAARP